MAKGSGGFTRTFSRELSLGVLYRYFSIRPYTQGDLHSRPISTCQAQSQIPASAFAGPTVQSAIADPAETFSVRYWITWGAQDDTTVQMTLSRRPFLLGRRSGPFRWPRLSAKLLATAPLSGLLSSGPLWKRLSVM